MTWWTRLFRRTRLEDELDAELQDHLAHQTDEYRQQGLDPSEAHRRAGADLGGLAAVKELCRDVRRTRLLDQLWQDLTVGVRALTKNPGFSVVVIAVLALGIGANSAIFSLVNVLLLKPLPIAGSGELTGVYTQRTSPPGGFRAFSYPNYRDLRESARAFTHLAAHNFAPVGIGDGAITRRVAADLVTANYFETFGSPLTLGRAFTQAEEEPDARQRVVIVSHDYWVRNGRSPDILGHTLRVNGDVLTIVGVAGEGFTGSSIMGPEVWLPLGLYGSTATEVGGTAGQSLTARGHHTLIVVGRLARGVTSDTVQPELEAIAAQLEQAYPAENEDHAFLAAPLSRMSIGTSPETDGPFYMFSALMLAMSGVVLLVACLNLANLFLARGAARRREIAIRLALGGGRGRVVRQLLVESFVLAAVGGAVGLVLALWAAGLAMTSLASLASLAPVSLALSGGDLDWRVAAGTLVFCLLSTVLFGLGPAWQLTGVDVLADLRQQSNPDHQRRRGLLAPRHLSIVGQVALALVLVTAGGLFLRGSVAASTADPGFSLERGVLLEVDPGLAGYDEPRGRVIYQELLTRLRGLPGVDAVSFASMVPFGAFGEARRVASIGAGGDDRPSASYAIVGDDYFRSLGVSMLRGREFNGAEAQSDTPAAVAIVDETLARALWQDGDPLGQQLRFQTGSTGRLSEPLSVVGIAPGRRSEVFDERPSPHVYVPFGWEYRSNMNIHLRLVAGGPEAATTVLGTIREEVQQFDERLPVLVLKTLEDFRADNPNVRILQALAGVVNAFGALALFLAVVGLYGVKASAVSRRTRELGIRMALGGRRVDVLWLVLREGLVVTLVGLGLGAVLSLGTARLLGTLLYGVGAFDPLVFLVASLSLAGSALLASYLPARKATRVDPVAALRTE